MQREWIGQRQMSVARLAAVRAAGRQYRGAGGSCAERPVVKSHLFPVRDIAYLDYAIMRRNDKGFFWLPVSRLDTVLSFGRRLLIKQKTM